MCFVVKETSIAGILDDETCMTNYQSEILHFRDLNSSIFVIFFFIWVKISHRVQIFMLEVFKTKSEGAQRVRQRVRQCI